MEIKFEALLPILRYLWKHCVLSRQETDYRRDLLRSDKGEGKEREEPRIPQHRLIYANRIRA
jgi:hypothetical protein